jgi:hypothetical protein
MARAMAESERCRVPFHWKPSGRTSTTWVVPFQTRKRRAPDWRLGEERRGQAAVTAGLHLERQKPPLHRLAHVRWHITADQV